MKVEISVITLGEKPSRTWRVVAVYSPDDDSGEQSFSLQPDYEEADYSGSCVSGSEDQCLKMANFMAEMYKRALNRTCRDDVEVVRIIAKEAIDE